MLFLSIAGSIICEIDKVYSVAINSMFIWLLENNADKNKLQSLRKT